MRKINISMTAQAVSSLRVLSSLQLIAQRPKMSKKILKIKQKNILPFRELFIQAGVVDLRTLGAIEIRITKTVEHPKYQPPTVYYDVSLALLEQVRS